jgi:hypothetical protein
MDEMTKRALEMQRKNCGHMCHTVGLNIWIEECPICGCPNPKYVEGARMCPGCWNYPCECAPGKKL